MTHSPFIWYKFCMQIIGLVGEKGSGKDTFANFLKNMTPDQKIAHIRFSDILKKTLKIWDLPFTRSNLQKLAQILEDGFGPGTVAHGIEIKIQKTSADIIILDGIRWWPDLELLEKFTDQKLVYITALSELRYGRLKKRAEKEGEAQMTYEQFLEEEKASNELLIPEIGVKAGTKIVNNGSIEDFGLEVKKFIQKSLG